MSGVVSVLIGLSLRFGRRFSETVRSWSDVPDYVFIVIGLGCLIIAGYQTWKDERNAKDQVIAELQELKVPKLEGSIASLDIGRRGSRKTSHIILWVTIKNHGADSIVDGYQLTIDMATRKVGPLSPSVVPAGLTFKELGITMPLSDRASLADKTFETPIHRGSQSVGILLFAAPTTPYDELARFGNRFTLTFRDIEKKQYSAQLTTSANMRSPAAPTLPAMPKYEPYTKK